MDIIKKIEDMKCCNNDDYYNDGFEKAKEMCLEILKINNERKFTKTEIINFIKCDSLPMDVKFFGCKYTKKEYGRKLLKKLMSSIKKNLK